MYFSNFHKALLTLTTFCLSYCLYFFVSLWYAMCLHRVQRVAYYCTLVRCQGIYPWDFCCLDKGYLVAWDLLQGPHPWLCPKLVFLGVATEFCVSYSVTPKWDMGPQIYSRTLKNCLHGLHFPCVSLIPLFSLHLSAYNTCPVPPGLWRGHEASLSWQLPYYLPQPISLCMLMTT